MVLWFEEENRKMWASFRTSSRAVKIEESLEAEQSQSLSSLVSSTIAFGFFMTAQVACRNKWQKPDVDLLGHSF